MIVHVTGGEIPQDEVERYKAYAEEHHLGTYMLDIAVDGEMVDLTFYVVPFQHVQRITGYLTGDVSRWNDAKREELGDRVKHGVI